MLRTIVLTGFAGREHRRYFCVKLKLLKMFTTFCNRIDEWKSIRFMLIANKSFQQNRLWSDATIQNC